MSYTQFEFFTFIGSLFANIVLAILVLRYAPKNPSRSLFSLFILAQSLWINANYFAFFAPDRYFLSLARITMFFAVFHALMFFVFVRTFSSNERLLKRKFLIVLGGLASTIAILTLSPLVFSGVIMTDSGKLSLQSGIGMPFFGLFIGFCILGAFYSLLKYYHLAKGIRKVQLYFLALGCVLTFVFVLIFSFFSFVAFKNLDTVRLGHLYTLPFIIFTTYSIIRHHLLNVKVIVAELSVFVLLFILLLQFLNSETITQYIIAGIVLVGASIVGTLLIKAVVREIDQLERFQLLNQQLASANEQLVKLDKAKSEFVSIASHQLRTPLTAIKGYISMVLDGSYGKTLERIKRPLTNVYSSNERLIKLVNDLLNLSRIESGKIKLELQDVQIRKIVESVIEELQIKAHEKSLQLIFQGQAIPVIQADESKVRNVIMNLVDNAIRYTEKGSITVFVEKVGEKIQIRVVDTGAGMEGEDLEELFESFSRGQAGTQLWTEGTGLGLYVARQFIEMHAGKIWAESEGKGKGSTFYVELPMKSLLFNKEINH